MSDPNQTHQPYERPPWPPRSSPATSVPAVPTPPYHPGGVVPSGGPAIVGDLPAQRPAERRGVMTGAETFWYVLGCISLAASYFAKIPAKKALAEYGYVELTAAEKFWYVLMCLSFGFGYFAKVPIKKAFAEALPSRTPVR